jgi:translation initiation factor 6 (eIF-6)
MNLYIAIEQNIRSVRFNKSVVFGGNIVITNNHICCLFLHKIAATIMVHTVAGSLGLRVKRQRISHM